MKHELIHTLTENFEGHAQQTDNGVEFWLARDLQHLLGYTKWDNFVSVISKAKIACEASDHNIADHFADVGKMVELSCLSEENGAQKSAWAGKRMKRDISGGLPVSAQILASKRFCRAPCEIANKRDLIHRTASLPPGPGRLRSRTVQPGTARQGVEVSTQRIAPRNLGLSQVTGVSACCHLTPAELA